jgi:hypothetical protein
MEGLSIHTRCANSQLIRVSKFNSRRLPPRNVIWGKPNWDKKTIGTPAIRAAMVPSSPAFGV